MHAGAKTTYIPLEVRSDGQVDLEHRPGDGLHMRTELQPRKVVNEPGAAKQAVTQVLREDVSDYRLQRQAS